MESKSSLDKVLLWADRHSAVILEYSFLIAALVMAIIISKPLYYDYHMTAAKTTLLFYPLSISLIRWLAGQKYKGAVAYIYGTLLLLIIVAFRFFAK